MGVERWEVVTMIAPDLVKPDLRRILAAALAVALVITYADIGLAADGDLDDTFASNGKVVTTFPGGAFATSVAIQADGKIVVAGAAAGESGHGEFAVARYEVDGSLDETFGTGGLVTVPVSAGGGDEARDVAIQPNGKIVVAGTAGRLRFAAARLRIDGALDDTFGDGGIVRTNITTGFDIAHSVAIQPNGRIVLAGQAGTSRPAFALVRYLQDGTLDDAFGAGGKVRTPFGVWGLVRDMVLQPDGRIVVAGTNGAGLAVARYMPDGTLDPGFGVKGKVGDAFDMMWADAVTLQPDGRIVVGGDLDIFRMAAARLMPDGELDPTFSDDGRLTWSVGSLEQGVTGLVVEPGGKIVAGGTAGPHECGDDAIWQFYVTRLRPSGRFDQGFGGDGIVKTSFPGGAFGAGLARQADGRVLMVGGVGEYQAGGFGVARYLA